MPVEYVIHADLTVKPSKLFVFHSVWLLFAVFSDPDTSSLVCKTILFSILVHCVHFGTHLCMKDYTNLYLPNTIMIFFCGATIMIVIIVDIISLSSSYFHYSLMEVSFPLAFV